MNKNNTKEVWAMYKEKELERLDPIIRSLGYGLDHDQIHTIGERHLMSGFKLVLNAKNKETQQKFIIKASTHNDGIREIEHEHEARKIINNIKFAYRNFLLPKEVLYVRKNNLAISVSSYIEQKKSLLEHSLEEQFFLTLRALEMQEGTHLTTRFHVKKIDRCFGVVRAKDYLDLILDHQKKINNNNPQNIELTNALDCALLFFKSNILAVEKYSDFLTHSDFVPHNIRIVDNDMYLLDHTAIQFGNKYESWARLINYLTIYNQNLEIALSSYVKNSREDDEYLSLRLMRIFKICFLLNFYSESLKKTEENLQVLTQVRVNFWTKSLLAVLDDKPLDQGIIREYKKERDALRSDEEIIRQKSLKQIP